MNNSNIEAIPEGFRKNALGHLVPDLQIKPIDKVRDDVVTDIVIKAKALRKAMLDFKLATMGQIIDFVDLTASEYGVIFGGSKGTVSLTSFEGQYQVRLAVGQHLVFEDRIQTAMELIDKCINF